MKTGNLNDLLEAIVRMTEWVNSSLVLYNYVEVLLQILKGILKGILHIPYTGKKPQLTEGTFPQKAAKSNSQW
jgi:hypothetical protein